MRSTHAPLRVAMIGTRGVPAKYGGFETAVEQIGARLVDRGFDIRVYCRDAAAESHLGMRRVELPALRTRITETLSHSYLSAAHVVAHPVDAALVFNAANAPVLPILRARGIPVATHVDGLEWQRAKWQGAGRNYYRLAESLAVRWSDALIADAEGIRDYYAQEFGATTRLISYGAPKDPYTSTSHIADLELEPGGYHLVVARMEPENHVRDIVAGYVASAATSPLVVVGSAPYAAAYRGAVVDAAGHDPRVRLIGSVWDQELLDSLYANACTYVHGHSVGGTNPSLLRAIGAQVAVVAYDVSFNREVLGEQGLYFHSDADVGRQLVAMEQDPVGRQRRARALRQRADDYDWDTVADDYEQLIRDLIGHRVPGPLAARRRPVPAVGRRPELSPVAVGRDASDDL